MENKGMEKRRKNINSLRCPETGTGTNFTLFFLLGLGCSHHLRWGCDFDSSLALAVLTTCVGVVILQEKGVLDAIQDYFEVDIPEVAHDNEDAFLEVLKKAGLTDGF